MNVDLQSERVNSFKPLSRAASEFVLDLPFEAEYKGKRDVGIGYFSAPSVGRSTLVSSFLGDRGEFDYECTWRVLKHPTPGAGDVTVNVVDMTVESTFLTVGQTLHSMDALFFMFDVCQPTSFDFVIKQVDRYCEMVGEFGIPLVIVGNKRDRRGLFDRMYDVFGDINTVELINKFVGEEVIPIGEVPIEEAKTYAASIGADYKELSAFNKRDVEQTFKLCLANVIENEYAIQYRRPTRSQTLSHLFSSSSSIYPQSSTPKTFFSARKRKHQGAMKKVFKKCKSLFIKRNTIKKRSVG